MTLPPADSLRAILLDLDDTILDDRAGRDEAWDIAVAHTLTIHPDLDACELHREMMVQTDWFWSDPDRHRRGRLDLDAARCEVIATALAALGRPDPIAAREASTRFVAHRVASQRLLDGAISALTRLRERFELLALVTNGASTPQRAKIERFELGGYLDHIQVEGEFGRGKPDREVFLHVFDVLGVGAEECLMVGDNLQADVIGALDAGAHAVWIDHSGVGRPPSVPPRPHASVRSLSELVERLG